MQYATPPRTEDSLGPSMAQHQQTVDPSQYQGNIKAGQSTRRLLDSKVTFICVGLLLLTMMCIVPIWNAAALMSDENYVFWVGRATPVSIMTLTIGLVLLYVATVFVFVGCARSQFSEQTVMMMANIFITLLGLILILMSLPLTRESVETYTTLMHQCDVAPQTHRLYEYSQVLQNIRATPECAAKYSVEECVGYEEAVPYTSFLKSMEGRYRCAGFCYHPTNADALLAAPFQTFGPAPGNSFCGGDYLASTSVLSMPDCEARCREDGRCRYFSYWATGKSHWCHTTARCDTLERDGDQVVWIYSRPEAAVEPGRWQYAQETKGGPSRDNVTSQRAAGHQVASRRRADHVTHASALQLKGNGLHASATARQGPVTASAYPPTLFSDANYHASCEGMAAREMKNFVGDVGAQTFYQGVYLVFIAIGTGFLKLVGFCARREQIDDKVMRG
mmetsp:Transcript_72081/g.187970  ORF Transcript_72081/g.187970 Transcript_72081/m.187970 type:complete len:448 (+) Transcript_72081:127-1470(+)